MPDTIPPAVPAGSDQPFAVKDCALIAIATGRKALTLSELRDTLQSIGGDSIYHHFWGGLLMPRFEEREFNNDFAGWAQHSLHDPVLAERLAVIDPAEHKELEPLRQELLDIIETRMDENETISWRLAGRQFEFLRSQIVVFDTGTRLGSPRELAEQLPRMSTSSVFYHFIDARRRLEDNGDDFRVWLAGCGDGHDALCAQLAAVDPFFSSLSQIRQELAALCQRYFQ